MLKRIRICAKKTCKDIPALIRCPLRNPSFQNREICHSFLSLKLGRLDFVNFGYVFFFFFGINIATYTESGQRRLIIGLL